MEIRPSDLPNAPALPARLTLLAAPAEDRSITGVRLVEDLATLTEIPPGTLAILTARASAQATGYRLDVALRDVAAAGGTALTLTTPETPPQVPTTAKAIAERSGTTLLHAAPAPGASPALGAPGVQGDGPGVSGGVDLAGLVVALVRLVEGDAAEVLVRFGSAVEGVLAARGELERAVGSAGAALGVPLRAGVPETGEVGAVVHGPDGDVAVAGPRVGGRLGWAVALVTRLVAESVARVETDDVPVRSRGLLLSELIVAPEGQALRLVGPARAVGLPVDGWHVALRIEPAALQGAERYELLDAVDRAALRQLRSVSGAQWNAARADDALLLVRSRAGEPGTLRTVVEGAERLLVMLRERFPDGDLRCGVGGAHQGPLGLRASAREARTALARAGDSGRPVSVHDLAGLDRMLGEWYASDTARSSAGELLAPVVALGPERARPLLRTLRAYLDHQGSPARAAEELHLHRNAVTDRVRRASALLGVDLADPEQRLAVQLACRALRL